jgi:anti-sigma factor RsiW
VASQPLETTTHIARCHSGSRDRQESEDNQRIHHSVFSMIVSAEKLSSFLDNELSKAEMDKVKDALLRDTSLAERLASMVQMEALVAKTYGAGRPKPLPKQVKEVLEKTAMPTSFTLF